MRDLKRLAQTVAFGTLLFVALSYFFQYWIIIPRSIPLLDGILALMMMGGVRMSWRMLNERSRSLGVSGKHVRVLILGAGEAGSMIAREMFRNPETKLVPVGFLDDEPAKQGQTILGLKVLGKTRDLIPIIHEVRADEALIAMPSAPGTVVRRLFKEIREAGIEGRIIPGVFEILSGNVSISQIRQVDLEDLLRRDPVRSNLEQVSDYVEDRTILVTGAGGSIGSETIRQLVKFHPKHVIMLGRGENSLFEIQKELEWKRPDQRTSTIIANIQNRNKLERLFSRFRPDVVFHTAAHKHVPFMEENPDECVFSNVIGTRNLVNTALEYGVQRFVNISTDKAVNPTSIMGASKRIAEFIVEAGSMKAAPGCSYVSVRFGNVLGSRGSVVPLFKEQIRRGGPLTLTHPDMTRYFMTIPEAVELVLQAAGLGENGSVYVLDMGEPVRMVDLATDLIILSGFEPGVDIEITFTGMRPGEKLFEELLTAEEGVVASLHEKIFVAKNAGMADEELKTLLNRLYDAAECGSAGTIRDLLRDYFPTLQHSPVSEIT
ncbi:polysaccharide biosynthesis protein [Gemmatimonadota bacterium]